MEVDMNGLKHYVVARAHLEDLYRDAENERIARLVAEHNARPSILQRLIMRVRRMQDEMQPEVTVESGSYKRTAYSN